MPYRFSQTAEELQKITDVGEDNIALEYDASVSYAVGSYCTHEGGLYRCTSAATGTWDASKWTEITVMGEIAANAEDISTLNSNLTKNTAYKLVRVSSVESQAISGITIFHYDVNVPTGYTIVAAWDDSYYAGLIAAPIRINQGSGTIRVNMAYYGNISTARKYTCAVLMLPNVTVS